MTIGVFFKKLISGDFYFKGVSCLVVIPLKSYETSIFKQHPRKKCVMIYESTLCVSFISYIYKIINKVNALVHNKNVNSDNCMKFII